MGDDPESISWAFVGRGDHLLACGRLHEYTEDTSEAIRFALDAGAVSMAAFQAGGLARVLLALGRTADGRDVVREGLAHSGVPEAGAAVRLSAALLSVRLGDLDAAEMHLERAKELIPNLERRPALTAPPILAEYLLARRKTEAALGLLSRTITDYVTEPRVADEMIAWGARAAADLAETARDRHDPTSLATARSALDELVVAHTTLPRPPFEQLVPDDLVQPAWEALFQAESQRCTGQVPTRVKSGDVVYDGWSFVVVVQAVMACMLRWSVASSVMMVSTACARARTSSPR